MTEALVGAGIACLIAAIVGGALRAPGFEIPALKSRMRQLLLGGLGGVLLVGGVGLSFTPGAVNGRPVASIVPLPSQDRTERPAETRTPEPTTSRATTQPPPVSLPPSNNDGVDLASWRQASEIICASATGASLKAPDPVSWAEVFLAASADLRSLGAPSGMATEAQTWHNRVDEVTGLWHRLAFARVNGDIQSDYQLTQESILAARRANLAARALGLSTTCYFAENV